MSFLGEAAAGIASSANTALASCTHCSLPCPPGTQFCCAGCEAAFETISGLGLGSYYAQRVLDPAARPVRPDATERFDLTHAVTPREDGTFCLTLAVEGVQCGACVWLIERVLSAEPGVQRARVNMTSRVLSLTWKGVAEDSCRLVHAVERLGYRLIPFDAGAMAAARDGTERQLLRALAVAGFAAGNVMLISIGTWAGLTQGMGDATRALMHWVSALIAMPAIAYAGMPFFRSAFAVLRRGRTNMDVPISVGVILVTGMSLVETCAGGRHTYFDSAITLLFFLLIGRVLDHRARGQARATAQKLLMLRGAEIALVTQDGGIRRCRGESVALGDRVFVGMGERFGVDGVIVQGNTMLDASLVTGESLPVSAQPGKQVFAGTLNIGPPVTVRVSARGEGTLLAECARLIEAAETRRGKIVALAEKVSRAYTPVVHAAALLTFLVWHYFTGESWETSLLTASAVLIITCPCALALAVPAVQVITTGRLFRSGILLKSPTALERLAAVDTVVFDKTGTLTQTTLALESPENIAPDIMARARSLAAASRHPLARAVVAASHAPVAVAEGVVERPGEGLLLQTSNGVTRLGSAEFCGIPPQNTAGPELWFCEAGNAPLRFGFSEKLRRDAAETVAGLRRLGLDVKLVSGDRQAAVAAVSGLLGIEDYRAQHSPIDKVAYIERLRAEGHRVMMVGDGLNDGPCLAAALVSASPSSGADISQNVADIVFQGDGLGAIRHMILAARHARHAMLQNLALALCYNALLVPLAMAGHVTPWLAAASMSSSSLLVMANSFRKGLRKP